MLVFFVFCVCDIINLNFTLALLSGRFPTWPKKPGQKFRYLRTKSFKLDIKSIFIILKGLPVKQIKPTFFEAESSNEFKCNVNLDLNCMLDLSVLTIDADQNF